jgi:hypothetical protein
LEADLSMALLEFGRLVMHFLEDYGTFGVLVDVERSEDGLIITDL